MRLLYTAVAIIAFLPGTVSSAQPPQCRVSESDISVDAAAVAHLEAGLWQEDGLCGPPDIQRVLRHYQAANSLVSGVADLHLGRIHALGKGIPKDEDKAWRYLRETALVAARDAGVQAEIERQFPLPPLFSRMADWIRKVDGLPAEQQYEIAMNVLGGKPVHDPALARRWFEAAALSGNSQAALALGRALIDGRIEARSSRNGAVWEGAVWLHRAALSGNRDAQVAVADHYDQTDPFKRLLALVWLLRAAEQGADVTRPLESLQNGMSSEDIRRGNSLAINQDFAPAPPF